MLDIQMVINRKEFDRLLKKLSAEEQDKVIRESLYESAQYLTGWIKTNKLSGPRPINLGVVTGRLRSSISTAPTQKQGNVYRAIIGTNVVYARRHEYGDVELGITHKKGLGIPPRPFMRPAVSDQKNVQMVKDDLVRNITEMLERP